MFGWFRKKKKHVEIKSDQVWKGIAGRNDGLLKRAREQRPVLVIAHFSDALKQLHEQLREHGLDFLPFNRNLLSSLPGTSNRVWTTLSEAFRDRQALADRWEDTYCLHIYVLGRFPTPEQDAWVEAFAHSVPFKVTLTHLVSMEDPLLQKFLSARSDILFENMGQNEHIEHAMVDKSIRRAQQTIAKKATGNQRASNEAEWLRLNLRE